VPHEFLQSPTAELVVRFTDKTLGVLESAIKLGELPRERLSRGVMLQMAEGLAQDDPAAALKVYEDTVDAYPENADALNSAARFLLTTEAHQLRDPKRAILWARKAVELTQEEDGHILDTLARALHEDGQLEEAARIQKRTAERSPDEAYVQRAKNYAEKLNNRK
jgi:tetratricopeptide (TPR) repeat protein